VKPKEAAPVGGGAAAAAASITGAADADTGMTGAGSKRKTPSAAEQQPRQVPAQKKAKGVQNDSQINPCWRDQSLGRSSPRASDKDSCAHKSENDHKASTESDPDGDDSHSEDESRHDKHSEEEDSGKEDESRDDKDSAKEDSGKEDESRDDKDSGKEDSGKEDSGKEDSGKEDSGKEDSGKEDSGKEDSGKEDSGKESGSDVESDSSAERARNSDEEGDSDSEDDEALIKPTAAMTDQANRDVERLAGMIATPRRQLATSCAMLPTPGVIDASKVHNLFAWQTTSVLAACISPAVFPRHSTVGPRLDLYVSY
jgi:hypothetical protein